MSQPESGMLGSMPRPKGYVPALGKRLKLLLYVLMAILALLVADSLYLVSITALESVTGRKYQDWFYQYVFLGHIGLGILLIVPFIIFGLVHMFTARTRRNRRAIRVGYALFAACIVVLLSGLTLMRVEGLIDLKNPTSRSVVYWLHVIIPLAAAWLYWLHRLAGPRIKWKIGFRFAAATLLVVGGMVLLRAQDPRQWNVAGPAEGAKYFEPSLLRTTTGNFIHADILMADQYCLECHKDAYNGWFHSAHHFSSFNNPAYLASVKETREVSLKRDGNVKASRWCAGCHDVVPFVSGAFDDPKFDLVNHPTAQAGITCTVCHAITHVNSTKGNGDFTMEEPQHYPFAFSENPFLRFLNRQLVRAKPDFHKATFLKPLHKSAEFCSTCHKVHLPYALNHYRDFLRGQNHYDSYLLSGVSGHGARSFYYPEKAKETCAACHMPLKESNDFGARLFADAKQPSIHSHLFPAANTGLPYFRGDEETILAHQTFLNEVMRLDIVGIKEEGSIDGKLHAPLRPEVPTLKRGQNYLIESVIRTLKMGHHFTQGTVDSNEVWVDLEATCNGRVIGKVGGLDEWGEVDPWSHFLNVFMLDRNGYRIDRRNPQDIFVPLYNHQIPPGAAQIMHAMLKVPQDADGPVTVRAKLQYRKFDKQYMDFVTQKNLPGEPTIKGHEKGKKYVNALPITTLAEDVVVFPVEGIEAEVKNPESKIPLWQRWNDYGIALFLEGQTGPGKVELRQAEAAFQIVEKLNRFDGPLNLSRVYFAEGRLDDAVAALERAVQAKDPPAPPWTVAWLSGLVNRQQGHLEEAVENFRSIVEDYTPETSSICRERGFDFSQDYEVLNELGQTLVQYANKFNTPEEQQTREETLRSAAEVFSRTLKLDSENVTAHYNLSLLYAQLGEKDLAEEHAQEHARYKSDDNARDFAITEARLRYPAANAAAEDLVLYSLHRAGAPGLEKTNPPATKESQAGGGR